MKRFLMATLFVAVTSTVLSQQRLNVGSAFIVDNYSAPGISVRLEYEKFYTEDFSSPVKFETGFVYGGEVNSLSLELHNGFRKYFESGLFVEQYVGIGAMANYYNTDDSWYFDKYQYGYRYSPGANWGLKPSTGAVLGYAFSKKSDRQHMIYIKADVYWNLGFRPLHLPYSSAQIGYSINLKTL